MVDEASVAAPMVFISQGDPSERPSIYCRMTENHDRQAHDESTEDKWDEAQGVQQSCFKAVSSLVDPLQSRGGRARRSGTASGYLTRSAVKTIRRTRGLVDSGWEQYDKS